MTNTIQQYDTVFNYCRDLFLKKMNDYGCAWRILRPSSITDQIYIKAQRIRSFENTGVQKIDEDISSEYIGIVNYSIIGLIQIELGVSNSSDLPYEEVAKLYEKYYQIAKQLMVDKNHDYGEAWRDMRISSLTDLILMKIFRVKQIEDNLGKTSVSEGIDANYMDMINYSVFALIKLQENK